MHAAVVQLNSQENVPANLARVKHWVAQAAASGAALVALPENFALAPAQHGKHPLGRQTYGKSLIVDPWGEVVAQCSEGEGFVTTRLDFDYQDRIRTSLPALLHRKLDRKW